VRLPLRVHERQQVLAEVDRASKRRSPSKRKPGLAAGLDDEGH
jgi:hypothetical protein